MQILIVLSIMLHKFQKTFFHKDFFFVMNFQTKITLLISSKQTLKSGRKKLEYKKASKYIKKKNSRIIRFSALRNYFYG